MNADIGKAQLRVELAHRRARAFDLDPRAGSLLCAAAPDRLFKPNTIVSGYWPFRTEIDPRPIMARFAQNGARLTLPLVPGRGLDGPLQFREWRPGDRLTSSTLGTLEPQRSAQPLIPDLLLVPLLGFDRNGGRLGYGAGHYDRTLKRLRAEKSVFALGLGFAAQEVDEMPTSAHDERLDAILTEHSLIEVC